MRQLIAMHQHLFIIRGAYTTGVEWNSGGCSYSFCLDVSIPQNVNVHNGTITIPNSGGTNRALAGNINYCRRSYITNDRQEIAIFILQATGQITELLMQMEEK